LELKMHQGHDIAHILRRWRERPLAVALLAAWAFGIMALVVAVGGPPTPVTHLFYLGVVVAGVLWGPWCGVIVGALSGAMAEPGSRAILGQLDRLDNAWMLRALAMMMVGWVCGSLARSLMRQVDELEAINEQTIFAFVRAIDARDPYTARHSEKVASYAVQLAQALGEPPLAVERIRLAGLLHDVGKVSLERSILHKPGRLTDEEWEQVRAHPGMSAHIIGGVERFAQFLPGARHHHERYDGQGYPDGLAGEDIPFDARILAVADAYDAMTSDRSYRAALSHEEALRRLEEGAGTQFDPVCVLAFAELQPDPTVAQEAIVPLLDLDAALPASA
jgi:HD domain